MTIVKMMSCPACGVVQPKRTGRCPACRARLRPNVVIVVFVGVFMTVVFTCALIQIRGFGWTAVPRMGVKITPGISARSSDDRGTDAWSSIENPNPVPVDVTIRVRGFDIADRAVVEKTIGPLRNLRPGAVRPIETYLDATPLKSVTFDAVAVDPADADSP
jgi:hypothetical protein